MINGNRTKSTRGRSPRDYYITPLSLATESLKKFKEDTKFSFKNNVLDAGCGNGIWGKSLMLSNCKMWCDGIDIESHITDNKQYYEHIIAGDFLVYYPFKEYGLVMGNPPYSLAEEFIRHSYELLYDEGYVYFLLRLSFLEGINRGKGLFKELPLKKVYVCSRRPSFFSTNEKHTTDTLAYGMFLWQKGYEGKPEIDWLDWNYNGK